MIFQHQVCLLCVNIKRLCCVFLLSALILPQSALATVPVFNQVIVFGDSLSAGYGINIDQSWPTLLQAKLKTQGYEYLVINASISGETTEGGSVRIGAALATFNPNLVILELGGNDGLRGFPPQIIKNNLV